MREACVQLFEEYLEKNQGSAHRALAETIQAAALLGLSRTDFFTHAAFYRGTALRLLYNLDRFSEDLDFSLLEPAQNFHLSSYLDSLQDEMKALGFSVEIESRGKSMDTPIESAFMEMAGYGLVEKKYPRAQPEIEVCKVFKDRFRGG